jgi:DNA polymerase III subunit delta
VRARRGADLVSAETYVVAGADPVLQAEALELLLTDLVGDDDRTLAVEDLTVPGRAAPGEAESDAPIGAEGRQEVIDAALNAAQSPPFMTGRRVVVLRDAGNLSKQDAEPLTAYLADPMDTTTLVLLAGGGRLPKSLADALRAAKAVTVGPANEKTGDVLAEHLDAAGISLRPEAKKLVSTHLGEDAGRVPQLVELLASAFGEGASLDVADVEPYLGDAGSVPGYLLTNAIETGDVVGALDTLRRMMTATAPAQPRPMHPLQAMGMLHSYYRRVARLDDPDVHSPRDAVAALDGRVKEYPARKALDAARAIGSDGVRQAFDHLFTADLDIKGARAIPEDAVMEVLVARLAALHSRARGGSRGGRAARARR